jgi:hypothetical protein
MMKTFALIVILVVAGGLVTKAQDGSAQLFDAVNALKRQQAEIVDNQAKLDEKLADVAEKIRAARIFMSRAGGKHKPPPPPK